MKTILKIIISFLLFLFSVSAKAQNLIPDSSFSQNYEKNNKTFSSVWSYISPFQLIVDQKFSRQANWISENGKGFAAPQKEIERRKKLFSDHPNFVEIFLYWIDDSPSSRIFSLIGCKLNKPLLTDSNYQISLLEVSGLQESLDRIQVYFSEKELKTAKDFESLTPIDLFNKNKSMLNNIDNWDTVTASFKAKGGEKYFYIGTIKKDFKMEDYVNYKDQERKVNKKRSKKKQWRLAYELDDVELKEIKENK